MPQHANNTAYKSSSPIASTDFKTATMTQPPITSTITPYQPGPTDSYMSAPMLAYFAERLTLWRYELEALIETGRQALEIQSQRQPDEIDDALFNQFWLEQSRQLNRHSQQCRQIDAALERIRQGTYGYCQHSGEEIGVNRLQAWPIAELSLAAQNQQEKQIKIAQARSAA